MSRHLIITCDHDLCTNALILRDSEIECIASCRTEGWVGSLCPRHAKPADDFIPECLFCGAVMTLNVMLHTGKSWLSCNYLECPIRPSQNEKYNDRHEAIAAMNEAIERAKIGDL